MSDTTPNQPRKRGRPPNPERNTAAYALQRCIRKAEIEIKTYQKRGHMVVAVKRMLKASPSIANFDMTKMNDEELENYYVRVQIAHTNLCLQAKISKKNLKNLTDADRAFLESENLLQPRN